MSKQKLFVIAAFLVAGAAFARADYRETPKGPSQALQTPAYGGVEVDVSTLGLAGAHNPYDGQGSVNSVMFSSGPCSAYVTFRDTDTATTSAGFEIGRVYNVANSSSGFASGGTCSGQVPLPYPLKTNRGLSWDPSVATFNFIGVGYTEHQ
jgi:hypothetical protein